MSSYLFIGGPLDGRTLEVPNVELHTPHVVLNLKTRKGIITCQIPEPSDISDFCPTQRFEYWPHRLCSSFKDRDHAQMETVFTLNQNEDAIDIIRVLIARYVGKID